MIEPKSPSDYVDWSKEIPKELWEQIIVEADEPALISTCELFKKIIYDPAIIVKNLKENFKDRFPVSVFEVKNKDHISVLNNARSYLIERALAYEKIEAVMASFEETKDVNFYSFTKVFKDEYNFILTRIFINIMNCEESGKIYLIPSLKNRADFIHNFIINNDKVISGLRHLEKNYFSLTAIPDEIKLFKGLEKVQFFIKIPIFPKNFGSSWSCLQKCELSHSSILKLPEDFGENWINLRKLKINNNKLAELPEEFGSKWANLETINISSNQMNTVPPNFGKNWTHLKSIDFFNNEIEILPPDFGSTWKELLCIRFLGNPLLIDENEFKEKTNKNVRIF